MLPVLLVVNMDDVGLFYGFAGEKPIVHRDAIPDVVCGMGHYGRILIDQFPLRFELGVIF